MHVQLRTSAGEVVSKAMEVMRAIRWWPQHTTAGCIAAASLLSLLPRSLRRQTRLLLG